MMKNVMHDDIFVGDAILCDGEYAIVEKIVHHAADQHPEHSPIRKNMKAVEFVTARGSRWKGVLAW